MKISNLVQLDRAGILGLLTLLLGFLHYTIFQEQDFLVVLMVILASLSVFFIRKDRQEEEITKMNYIILFSVIGGILLFTYYAYSFNLFS